MFIWSIFVKRVEAVHGYFPSHSQMPFNVGKENIIAVTITCIWVVLNLHLF